MSDTLQAAGRPASPALSTWPSEDTEPDLRNLVRPRCSIVAQTTSMCEADVTPMTSAVPCGPRTP